MKLAKFMTSRGHDVRILTADDISETPSEFDRARIHSAPVPVSGGIGSVIWERMIRRGAGTKDPSSAWRRPALEAAKAMIGTWRPDIIYAMCPPHSTATLAAQISRTTGVPFVTDFSERWAYGSDPALSQRQRDGEKQRERAVLSRASGIVTTSPVWAESYARRYGAEKVALALNGFDPDEYPLSPPVKADDDRNTLKVLCTTDIRLGQIEPRMLFKAVAKLGEGAKDIRIAMVGNHSEEIFAMAKEERVHKQLDLYPPEPREDLIERQYQADVLAMILDPDAHEVGSVATELFECIGTRRPVIGCGLGKGVNAEVIRKRDLGVVSNEPKVIANALARSLAKKRPVGVVPMLSRDIRENATMAEQFAGLDSLLRDVMSGDAIKVAAE